MLSLSDLDAYSQPEPSSAPRQRALPSSSSSSRQGGPSHGGVSQSLLSAAMVSSGEPILASAPPASRAGALTRAPATHRSLSIPVVPVKQQPPMLPMDMPFAASGFPSDGSKEELVEGKVGVTIGGGVIGGGASGERGGDAMETEGGCGKPEGPRGQLMRRQRAQQSSFVADAPVSSLDLEGGGDDGDGRQQSFKADAPCELDDGVKLGEDHRRDLMSKQKVQPSFVADAPVSLEQVRVFFLFERPGSCRRD